MSQENIIIVVDIDKIKKEKDLENDIYNITNAQDCIYMYDDQSHAFFKEGTKESQLISTVSAGCLVTWTLLPTDISFINDINLESIESKSRIFEDNKPFIYCKNKRACLYISDDYIGKSGSYKYDIIFKYKNDRYTWDPLMQVRGDG